MKAKNILLTATFVVIISSCSIFKINTSSNIGDFNNTSVKTEVSQKEESPSNVIIKKHDNLNGKWRVVSIDSSDVESNDSYIEFEYYNQNCIKCYAYDGCNYINGEYKLKNDSCLERVSDFISTLKSCDNDEYEDKMVASINNVTGFVVEQNGVEYQLKLKNSQGETLLLLKRTAFESYNGAWSVTFINGIAVDNYLNLKLVFDIENNSVHGNIGCNTMNGVINTHTDNPDKISFSNMITTRMSCPNMEIEIALLKALESVVEINLGENNSEAYLLDEKGSNVVNLQRLVIK